MANKRDIKKRIHYVCGELAMNCIFAQDYIPGIDPDAIAGIVMRIAKLQSHALENLHFSFDKVPSDFENRKEYRRAANRYNKAAYKSFADEFNKKLKDIVTEMNGFLTPEQREINKNAACNQQ